ncbi:hypothetical protein D3C73_1408530 [compost metagenome]
MSEEREYLSCERHADAFSCFPFHPFTIIVVIAVEPAIAMFAFHPLILAQVVKDPLCFLSQVVCHLLNIQVSTNSAYHIRRSAIEAVQPFQLR